MRRGRGGGLHLKVARRHQTPGRGGPAPPKHFPPLLPTSGSLRGVSASPPGLLEEPAQPCNGGLCDLRQAPPLSGPQFLHMFEATVTSLALDPALPTCWGEVLGGKEESGGGGNCRFGWWESGNSSGLHFPIS